MKKMLICLSLLTLLTGIAFAKTCNRCGTEYYGGSCPYCKGYSNGIEDKYTGSNSASQCNDGDYYSRGTQKGSVNGEKQRTESSANCYEGYDDAIEGRGSKSRN